MPKKFIPPTKEQMLENNLRNEMRTIYLLPEPTYFFEVGDRVEVGNLDNCVVEQVLENGKIYLIDYTDYNHNYGKPIRTPHSKHYFNWLSVRPVTTANDQPFIKNEDLKLYYSQTTISNLFGNVYSFGTDFDPVYQRGYVWTEDDKVALIDSIFNNVDIGRFVFVFLGYSREKLFEILDGKQRLRTICDFYENRLPYQGKYFNQLSRHNRYHFTEYHVSVCRLENLTEQEKLRFFILTNTAGKIMDKEFVDRAKKMLNEKPIVSRGRTYESSNNSSPKL